MSPTRSRPPLDQGARYHHGDLREALIDAAIELIAERGIHGFSLAEASRRVGVSSAAPYRHFADRDELIVAVAIRALQTFTTLLAHDASQVATPDQQLAATARGYVCFAAEHRALFETLLHSGSYKSRYPDLQRAWEAIDSFFFAAVTEISNGDSSLADVLARVLEATAHGHAVLLLDGDYDDLGDPTAIAGEHAARATLALIEGREALRGP